MATLNEILPLLSSAEPRTLDRIHGMLTHRMEIPKAVNIDVSSITFAEAAKRLGVGRSTIARLAQKGVFKIVKLNAVQRINLQSFIDYASGRSVLASKA